MSVFVSPIGSNADGAARLLAVLADPADLPVGMLLEDLRVPLGRLAADVATQCRRVSSSCWTCSTPSMKSGKSSNCVHWLYAVETGTSTSIDSSIVRGEVAGERHARQAAVTATLERHGNGAAHADRDEDRVAELVTALLLDARPRAIEVLRHLDELVLELPVGGEPCRGGDEADAARGPARAIVSMAHRRQELLAELLVLRECGGVIGRARGAVLQYL